MKDEIPLIRLVDDEPATRTALERLLRAAGYRTETFASAGDFLASKSANEPGCLVLDVHMPGVDGLELQRILQGSAEALPIIFLTCHGTIRRSVEAMKAGAVDFLTKPVEMGDLLQAIQHALERDRSQREDRRERAELRRRYDSLTPREREVLVLVVAGHLNKQIAGQLGTSEQNIKFHRGHVMEKMEAESLADLVRMAERMHL
ncbi:MAG: response regulator transcription factor [Verrucomicrobia bacterium]|nr:response regulator transcription factor [Verrucomicrobiota bacterium]